MHNSGYHHPARRSAQRPRQPRCIAFVDARFVDWLSGKEDAERGTVRLEGLRPLLENLLEEADVASDLVRIYWYGSQTPGSPVWPAQPGSSGPAAESAEHRTGSDGDWLQGQVFRWVAPESTDTGVSMVLSMSRDLMALTQNGACEHVLVVSDDDRLLPVIDHVQSCGVQVCVLADESAQDLSSLARTDPAWASVLRQADTRMILPAADLERSLWGDGALGVNGKRNGSGRDDAGFRQARHRQGGGGQPDDAALRSHLGPMVASWWTGMEPDAQSELARQLPEQRGLPQETDRSLLLHLSQQLGRPLTLHEKKAMREITRDVVTGSESALSGPADIPE
ncbi:MAG: hypothetical protein RI949_1216 [Pseudomonadota bacterium]